MGEARRPEADLRDLQPVALAHQHVLGAGSPSPSNSQLAMAAMLLRPHDRDAAQDAPAGLVLVEQEGRQPLARIVRGARHEDEVRGLLGAGDEPLAAGDDVGVAAAARPGSGSSPGSEPPPGCGSVMAKAERTSPSHDRRRASAAFCSGVADLLQHHHVAVVGRGGVEHDRAEDRAVHRLVADRHADLAEARRRRSRASAAGTTAPRPAPWPRRRSSGRSAMFSCAS